MYDGGREHSTYGETISLLSWLTIGLIAVVLIFSNAERVESDTTSPKARIQELERSIQEHPGVFDWRMHNELRHLYITDTPPRLKDSMRQADIILKHSIMDDYILKILSEWQLGRGPEFATFARGNLLMKVRTFPDLRFLGAASLLTIGDVYAMEGNLDMARSSYLKVASDRSYDMEEYRVLADKRLHVLKEQPKQAAHTGIVGSYRGTAGIETQGVQRRIPIMLDIHSEFLGVFTGYVTIEAANVMVPIQGKDAKGDFTAAGSVPDRSLSIVLNAKRSGGSITGRYRLTVSDYRRYKLDSRFPSGDFTVSR